MRSRTLCMVAAAALGAAACGSDQATYNNVSVNNAAGPSQALASISLKNASGETIGTVRGSDSVRGATFVIEARGLPPGEHGVHLHDVGLCETPDFSSAGSHWNPTGAKHGGQNPQGPHMGDLQNVTVGPDGALQTELVVAGAFFDKAGRGAPEDEKAILDSNGAALVIHAKADDYRTDPSGSSGDRIACAVLGAPEAAASDQEGS